MAPLLYARLGIHALRNAAVRAAVLEPFRLADLRALLDALAVRGVAPLIVKGTALAYSLYDAPEQRYRPSPRRGRARRSASRVPRARLRRATLERRHGAGDVPARRRGRRRPRLRRSLGGHECGGVRRGAAHR